MKSFFKWRYFQIFSEWDSIRWSWYRLVCLTLLITGGIFGIGFIIGSVVTVLKILGCLIVFGFTCAAVVCIIIYIMAGIIFVGDWLDNIEKKHNK